MSSTLPLAPGTLRAAGSVLKTGLRLSPRRRAALQPRRYSPAEVVDAVPEKVMGNPDLDRICMSHIERQNLSIRMGMRRMTRLTNAFSKKWENLQAAYSLWFAYYNFCRTHKTLRVTPAMEAGIANEPWTIERILSN